jgi:glycosyltransferase involved in cell wall biosynthesis
MRLLIVSDTYMRRENGVILVYTPVVREMESIKQYFDHVTWIGMEDTKRQQNAVSNGEFDNVKFFMLPKVGGSRIIDKLISLIYLPYIFIVILYNISKHDTVHTRGPCLPAYVAVWTSWLFRGKRWWNKFATNWNTTRSSLSFQFHKYILVRFTFSKVTINGVWPNLPNHVLSFENPCLSKEQDLLGATVAGSKVFLKPYRLVFIGNLEQEKGTEELLSAISNIKPEDWSHLDIVGEGSGYSHILQVAEKYHKKVTVHGSLPVDKVHSILSESHFLLLPSHSEGFPKVIAEAICWGCIPVVSAIGSIPQYIENDVNGFLWDLKSDTTFTSVLDHVLSTDPGILQEISGKAREMSYLFTFDRYAERVRSEILK